MLQNKIVDNNSVLIQKTKGSLKNNKFAYFEMYILELSKVLMHESYYHCIESN